MRTSIFGEQSLSSATQEWIKVQLTPRAATVNWACSLYGTEKRLLVFRKNFLEEWTTLWLTSAPWFVHLFRPKKTNSKKTESWKKIRDCNLESKAWLGNVNNKMWALKSLNHNSKWRTFMSISFAAVNGQLRCFWKI